MYMNDRSFLNKFCRHYSKTALFFIGIDCINLYKSFYRKDVRIFFISLQYISEKCIISLNKIVKNIDVKIDT